jgi:hypothetical protein
MNPMAMMGGMMQPPVEQTPQADPATMLTAVIAAVQSMQEMTGGNKGNDAQMDRLLDKMDEMRKETEDLKLKLVEAEGRKTGIGAEEVRSIIGDAISRNSANHANIQEGVKVLDDLKSFKDGMIDLGWVKEANAGTDPKHTLEERKLDHQIKMDDRRDKQDHELRIKAEEAEAAKEDAKGAFLSGLFASAQTPSTENDDEKEAETPIDVVRVDSRPASVIS